MTDEQAEWQPPKYARVVLTLRERIARGDYAPGALLPSESQLVAELGVGRTTIVRALGILQQEGWITREHGRGSYARGRPDREPAMCGCGDDSVIWATRQTLERSRPVCSVCHQMFGARS